MNIRLFFFLVEESTLLLVWIRLVEVISSPFEQHIVSWIFRTTALTQQISYTYKCVTKVPPLPQVIPQIMFRLFSELQYKYF